jgi:hypothetical protein
LNATRFAPTVSSLLPRRAREVRDCNAPLDRQSAAIRLERATRVHRRERSSVLQSRLQATTRLQLSAASCNSSGSRNIVRMRQARGARERRESR